jgi:EmrB/QacA subfamily drug resistance transporter
MPSHVQLGEASGRWVVAAAVLGSALVGVDATVVNIALPALGNDLHSGFEGLQWTVNGYALTLAALILLGGSLGDRYGRRRIFILGTVWFAIASALCALAPTIEVLVAARALQGVGGALLTPGSLALIAASFSEQERPTAIGVWSGFGGTATAIGPFLGGYLIAGPGWRSIFLINVPLAIIVVLIARRHVPESRDPYAASRLDLAGAALGALGLGGVTYALIGAGRGWAPDTLGSGAVGVVALVAFVVNECRSDHPMVPTGVFANRQFAAANIFTLIVYAALAGFFFFLVVDLQVVAGFSPLLAGTALLPVTFIMLVLSPRAGALAGRIGPRLPMTIGPFVAASGLLLLVRVGPGATYVRDVLPGVTVFALGLALIVSPLTTTVMAAAESRYLGVASGVNNAVARAAGLLAVAVLPALAGISGDAYHDPRAFNAGFEVVMMTCAALLGLGGIFAALSIRNPPQSTKRDEASERLCCPIDGPPLQASATSSSSIMNR